MKNINYMICALLFVASAATAYTYNISAAPKDGEELLLKNGDKINGIIDGTERKVRILVAKDAEITLENAQVLGANNGYESAGIRCLGNCTIVLKGQNVMRGYHENFPGVQVANDENDQKYTLTIQGDGSLEASSNGYGAGIGCNRSTNCGHIVIKSGVIKATGGFTAAGIGSSKDAHGGDIVIEDGEITAAGGDYAAGIGAGGYKGSECGNITISGGKIIAMGGDPLMLGDEGAAGIGSGRSSKCKNIEITKDVAKVIAIKGKKAPYSIGGSKDFVGTVTVDGVEGSIEENPFMRSAKAVEIVTPGSKTIGIINGDYSGNEAVNFAKDMVVDTIIFKRTFPVVAGGNNFSTIMFPFETKAEEVDSLERVFMFLGIGVDKSNNKYVAVERVYYSNFIGDTYTMEAYKPYLIKLKSKATNIVIKKPTDHDLVLKATPTEDGDFDVMQSDEYNQYGNYVFRGVVQGKTWAADDAEILGTNKTAAYGFAGTASTGISVGQFVKVAEGAYIKPFHAYIYKSPVPQNVKANGAHALRQTASINDDVPETMKIVVVDREKDGGEQTTVIGQFNSRTGEIRLNSTQGSYDLKGRSVRDANHMAKGVYLKK